jgi:hypothetical protein
MAERSRPGTSPPPEAAGPFASSWRRRHLTVDERIARGLAARQEAPRSSHGRWEPAPDFSAVYADQNERDYAAFAAAIDSGRLAAQTGV